MGGRLREFLVRVGGLFRPPDDDADLVAEIREHLRLAEADHRRRGLNPEDARRAAHLAFGNITRAREIHRDQRTLPPVESLVQDVRYALRLLRRAPGFTIAAVLTLALGIGLNTTLFTALNAVAFRPLPVRGGERLVRVRRWFPSENRGDIQYAFSEPEFRYIAAQAPALTNPIAAGWPVPVEEASGEHVHVQFVSSNYFDVLGVVPRTGSMFGPASASDAGVVLSDTYWRRRFEQDPRIAGRTITLNGAAFTISGVTPRSFVGTANPPAVPDVWAPMSAEGRMLGPRTLARRYQLLGHLSPGLTRGAAEARLAPLVRPLADTFRADDPTTALTLERATYFGETSDPRFLAFVAVVMLVVALILLIACANLANMLLARATGRQKEIGMRLALGASRGRLVRQLLTESLLLALLGGAAGLALSIWAARLLWVLIAEPVRLFAHGDVAPLVDLTVDIRIFLFTAVVSVLAAAAFGLLPALRISRPDLIATLKDDASLFGQRVTGASLRRWFVAGQVAVSMALLLAAGLLLRGLVASRHASTGYDTTRVFDVLYSRPDDPPAAARMEERIVHALARAPGLSVALVDRLPLAGTWTPPMTAHGASGRIVARTFANRVSPEYFSTLGVAIVRGRGFRRDESATAVAVISERTARLFWPGHDPLGRSFTLDLNFRGKLAAFNVIGIARDVRTASLSRPDASYVYLPLESGGRNHVMVRSAMAPRDGVTAIHQAVGSIDPTLLHDLQVTSLEDGPLRLTRSMIDVVAEFAAALAAIALALAIAGIYGVVAYLTGGRRHEIGVRLVLGARRADVLRLVLIDGLSPVAFGASAGIALALALSAVLQSALAFPETPDVLFGVSAFDAVTFGGATVLLGLVTLAASAGPLWRATRVDPVIALRST